MVGPGSLKSMGRRRAAAAVLACAVLSSLAGVAHAADFQIVADQKGTVSGAQLCLAVDRGSPLAPARAANVAPLSGTFYPVLSARCDALGPDLPARWSFTDTRELRIAVNGAPLCLTARFMSGFTPLLDPFLAAFRVAEPGSPFAYLIGDLKRDGVVNADRLRANPDLVAGPCGRADGTDFWVYDPVLGIISGPGGYDDKARHGPRCVTMHGDWGVRPPRHDAGMPVSAADCPDLWSFNRAAVPAHQRWSTPDAGEAWPTYAPRDPKDYFSGARGLPIVGPMGRCLTADLSARIAVTSDCDGRVEQDWVVEGEQVRLGPKGDCLERAADGKVALAACSGAASQKWTYVVKDHVPNPRWRNADVYGQIHPGGDRAQCLAVTDDPFADPVRQRNPLRVAACASVLPRQTSWFRSISVRTVRVALLRFANDDGSNPALGARSEADLKRAMESMVAALSEHYRPLGVRFVFDPDHDYMLAKDTVANTKIRSNEEAASARIARIASGPLYGKLVIAVMAGMGSGGFSDGAIAEFEPARIVRHVERTPNAVKLDTIPRDRAGVPAIAYFVGETGITARPDSAGHHAHEVGHYLGLIHTFGPDELADTPEDAHLGDPWIKAGAITCGNPRSMTVDGRRVTPDRNNNQSYWGCNLGRARNSFSPLQLGKSFWVLNNQLNRYPLVACQPMHPYDANRVECENAASLALCRETADYLQRRTGTALACGSGGRYTRAIAAALAQPPVLALLRDTGPGRMLMNKLAGQPAQDRPLAPAAFDRVTEALKAGGNLAVTMAVVDRLQERGGQPSAAQAGQTFTPAFIANVPAIVGP
jgi:hypothetical protein